MGCGSSSSVPNEAVAQPTQPEPALAEAPAATKPGMFANIQKKLDEVGKAVETQMKQELAKLTPYVVKLQQDCLRANEALVRKWNLQLDADIKAAEAASTPGTEAEQNVVLETMKSQNGERIEAVKKESMEKLEIELGAISLDTDEKNRVVADHEAGVARMLFEMKQEEDRQLKLLDERLTARRLAKIATPDTGNAAAAGYAPEVIAGEERKMAAGERRGTERYSSRESHYCWMKNTIVTATPALPLLLMLDHLGHFLFRDQGCNKRRSKRL